MRASKERHEGMSLFNQKGFHNRMPVFGLEDEKKYTGTMHGIASTRPKKQKQYKKSLFGLKGVKSRDKY